MRRNSDYQSMQQLGTWILPSANCLGVDSTCVLTKYDSSRTCSYIFRFFSYHRNAFALSVSEETDEKVALASFHVF